jgi:hypothetical protein
MFCDTRCLRLAGLPVAASLAFLFAGAMGDAARADSRLEARYTVSVAGIPIGKSEINVVIGSATYTTSASGRASGVLRALVSGEGSVVTRGTLADGRLIPASFTSSISRDDEKSEVDMTLADGAVKDLTAQSSAPGDARVPVTAEHRKGIVDPLTALLIRIGGAGDGLDADACRRTLPIFDGRRRYDLVLSFRRIEQVKAKKGYSGPAVVCAVAIKAIAGYRPGSPLVNYLTDGREIELTFAPITGTRMLAPFRLSVANMLGNMVVEAAEFESAEIPAPRAALYTTATAH